MRVGLWAPQLESPAADSTYHLPLSAIRECDLVHEQNNYGLQLSAKLQFLSQRGVQRNNWKVRRPNLDRFTGIKQAVGNSSIPRWWAAKTACAFSSPTNDSEVLDGLIAFIR